MRAVAIRLCCGILCLYLSIMDGFSSQIFSIKTRKLVGSGTIRKGEEGRVERRNRDRARSRWDIIVPGPGFTMTLIVSSP